mmetsp:Transcript_27813/g.66083  ORF Transcript_27813/g.66083 Transcript_27813/m.66083 type:complete len:220 (-) Transcript_27813:337-996(-)
MQTTKKMPTRVASTLYQHRPRFSETSYKNFDLVDRSHPSDSVHPLSPSECFGDLDSVAGFGACVCAYMASIVLPHCFLILRRAIDPSALSSPVAIVKLDMRIENRRTWRAELLISWLAALKPGRSPSVRNLLSARASLTSLASLPTFWASSRAAVASLSGSATSLMSCPASTASEPRVLRVSMQLSIWRLLSTTIRCCTAGRCFSGSPRAPRPGRWSRR